MNRTLEIVGLSQESILRIARWSNRLVELSLATHDLPTGHLITLEDVHELTVTCSLLPVGAHLQHVAQATGMTTVRPISRLAFMAAQDFGDGTADDVH